MRPGRGEPARFQPTWRLRSAVMLGMGMPSLALALHRPILAVLALPFAVPALRALAARPAGVLVADPMATSVDEGESVRARVALQGAPGTVTVSFGGTALLLRRPATGASTGAGEAWVDLEPVRWGSHELGEGQVVAVDPSGCWQARAGLLAGQLQVRPTDERMLGGSGVNQPLGIQGAHLSATKGAGTELAEVREYRPGDRLRRIMWNRSSRGDDLYVVDAFTERDTDVLLVLDSLQPVVMDDRGGNSLDLGARAVLALARHYLAFGDRVAVHDLGGRVRQLRLGAGPRQLKALHELLAGIPVLAEAAQLHHVPTPRPGTLVFFCSPLIDDDAVAEVRRLLALGAEVLVVDTFPPIPEAARGRLRRGEGLGRHLDAPGARGAWRLRLLRRDAVTGQLERQGIGIARWSGPGSLAGILRAREHARQRPRVVRR